MRSEAYRETLNPFPLVMCPQLGFWGMNRPDGRKLDGVDYLFI
jgi:hypothetical protein